MGTWNEDPFGNDDALDLLGDLTDVAPEDLLDSLRGSLELPEGYVEYPEGAVAVAVAALLASSRGYVIEDPTALEFLEGHDFEVPQDLRALAVEALDRVSGEDSELRELWEEEDLWASAEHHLISIRNALS
jgi:hypothetical protein